MPQLPILDKGPAEVVWNYGESGATYLGRTLGGVRLGYTTEKSDINEDQAGIAAVDAIFTGSEAVLECIFARSTREQIAIMLNSEVVDGQIIPLLNQVGCDLYDQAREIVIKPMCNNVASVDPAEWIHLYHCFPLPALDLMFDVDTQRTLPITFAVFMSQESGFENEFGTIGMASGSAII